MLVFLKRKKYFETKQNKNCFIFRSQKCRVSGRGADPSFQYILRFKDMGRKWSAWRYNERKLSSEGFTDNMWFEVREWP